ncbi:MAG: MerC domain-containing protein [Candidatus Omnitrophica bacterium]|nr:MerC domain-containing protein [Candidatus Omnitrophota bacterium]
MNRIRIALFLLPILWAIWFSFHQVLGVVFLTIAFLALVRYEGWHAHPTLLSTAVGAGLLALLYSPPIQNAGRSAIGVTLLVIAGLALIVWITRFEQREHEPLTSWKHLLLYSTGLIPILLGGVPTFLLMASSAAPKPEFPPIRGWWTAVGTILLWVFFALVMSGIRPPRRMRNQWPIAIVVILLACVTATRVFRIESIGWELAHAKETDLDSWDRLLSRSLALDFPNQSDDHILDALESPALAGNPIEWIHWAKHLSGDAEGDLDTDFLPLRLLAFGGKPFEDRIDSETESFVGIEIDADSLTLYLLTDSGRLFGIDANGVSENQVDPEVGPFVHLTLGRNQTPVMLEAGGRLLSASGGAFQEIIPSQFSPEFAYMMRLAYDPTEDNTWAMDRFGVVFRADPEGRKWIRDERFLPIAKTPDGLYPTAQDIAVDSRGNLGFLNCYGEVWSSSLESTEIYGPERGSHFFPDFPVSQSLGANEKSWEIVDRYGGFYHEPYPSAKEELALRDSFLFPRSLPRRDPEVVDHVYLPEHRWLYLLTKSGRILTNKKWQSYWAR